MRIGGTFEGVDPYLNSTYSQIPQNMITSINKITLNDISMSINSPPVHFCIA